MIFRVCANSADNHLFIGITIRLTFAGMQEREFRLILASMQVLEIRPGLTTLLVIDIRLTVTCSMVLLFG